MFSLLLIFEHAYGCQSLGQRWLLRCRNVSRGGLAGNSKELCVPRQGYKQRWQNGGYKQRWQNGLLFKFM